MPFHHIIKLLFWTLSLFVFCLYVCFVFMFVLSFCRFVFLSFRQGVTLWSNVWRVSSLKCHSFFQNPKVAGNHTFLMTTVGIVLPGRLKIQQTKTNKSSVQCKKYVMLNHHNTVPKLDFSVQMLWVCAHYMWPTSDNV